MVLVQRLAASVVGEVMAGRNLDGALQTITANHRDLSTQDRAALQDISYGTLRFLGLIDALLDGLLKRPLTHEPLRQLLRVTLYQLEHTRAAPHAVVDHAVRSCVALGQPAAKGLVNAVLRGFLRKREALLAIARRTDSGRYSHPRWWTEKLRTQWPDHYRQILSNANQHPPLTLRVNRRSQTVGGYIETLTAAHMPSRVLGGSAVMLERPVPVRDIPGFETGHVSVQDAAAQETPWYLDVSHGQRVLDACAAPGGKTLHILECADVDLTALDADPVRLERVRSNMNRLRLQANLLCGDAAVPSRWWDGKPYARILADVPCSASGVVRRHPDIKWLRRPTDIARFVGRQREILEALWRLLDRDGKLLYVTCSVFVEENNDQIEAFLERHHDARRLSLPAPQTNARQVAGQIVPDETHDGFFYALLQKS